MHKLDCLDGAHCVPHSFAAIFTTETIALDTTRLRAGLPEGDAAVILELLECFTPPFVLLYVLHTPRGEGTPGRYESPLLSSESIRELITRFATYFKGDARFDLWIHSPETDGTIVWDRHNLVYGYGPLDCMSRTLRSLGFAEGRPEIPFPHRHHYRSELDGDAAAILSAFAWKHSPLLPQDEQRPLGCV